MGDKKTVEAVQKKPSYGLQSKNAKNASEMLENYIDSALQWEAGGSLSSETVAFWLVRILRGIKKAHEEDMKKAISTQLDSIQTDTLEKLAVIDLLQMVQKTVDGTELTDEEKEFMSNRSKEVKEKLFMTQMKRVLRE